MYGAILLLHIAGALGTALYALLALVPHLTHPWLQPLRALQVLAAAAAVQIISGSALALLSPQVSAIALCDNLAVYAALMGTAAFFIAQRSEMPALSFARVPASLLSISLVVFVGAVVAGV